MENREYRSYGEFLYEERIRAGLTLREYCNKHNLSPVEVSHIEIKKPVISEETRPTGEKEETFICNYKGEIIPSKDGFTKLQLEIRKKFSPLLEIVAFSKDKDKFVKATDVCLIRGTEAIYESIAELVSQARKEGYEEGYKKGQKFGEDNQYQSDFMQMVNDD